MTPGLAGFQEYQIIFRPHIYHFPRQIGFADGHIVADFDPVHAINSIRSTHVVLRSVSMSSDVRPVNTNTPG